MRVLPILLFAIAATAEISIDPSIEWSVVDSDLVVRGRVIAVKPLRREGIAIYETAVFRIEETLKGPVMQTVRFELVHAESQPWVAKERPFNVEALCFLKRKKKGQGWELRYDESDDLVRLDKAFLTDAGGKHHEGRDAVLAAVRRAIAIMPNETKLRSLVVEHPVVPNPDAVANVQYFEVPIDQLLEARAHHLIGLKKDKLRYKGVTILRQFKSDQNVALLKKLLKSDAATQQVQSPHNWGVLPHVHDQWRVYWLRAEAWRILKVWGIQVARPVLMEPVGE